ncbi:MAG: DNA repair protein RadC [bacterium]
METQSYIQGNDDLVLNVAKKQYFLKVRDLPDDEKPREKLTKYGIQTLTANELLAIVLGCGTRKEEVLVMSNRILHEYGEKALVSQSNPKELADQLDIPQTKACQIVACFELGRRYFHTTRKMQTLRTAEQVYDFVQDIHTLLKEHLRGLYLDAHYRVIHDEVISIGSVDSSPVHPREVFRPAIEVSASAVILVHNHPSGVSTPSEQDIMATQQVVKAGKLIGIDILDHLVVTKNGFSSIIFDYLKKDS